MTASHRRSLLRSLTLLSLIGLLALHFQNCANYDQSGLFDGSSNITQNLDPKRVRLNPPGQEILVRSGETILTFGGECSVGEAVRNYIEFKILPFESNVFMPLSTDPGCQPGNTTYACVTFVQAQCEHGRYYAAIPVATNFKNASGAQNFYLQGQLVTVDSTGHEERDSRYGSFGGYQITVQR